MHLRRKKGRGAPCRASKGASSAFWNLLLLTWKTLKNKLVFLPNGNPSTPYPTPSLFCCFPIQNLFYLSLCSAAASPTIFEPSLLSLCSLLAAHFFFARLLLPTCCICSPSLSLWSTKVPSRDGSLTQTWKTRPKSASFVAGIGIKNRAKMGMGWVWLKQVWVWVRVGYNHTHAQTHPILVSTCF